MKANTVKTNFTGGALSPRLYGRTDIDRYQSSAKVLENVATGFAMASRPSTGTSTPN